MCFDHGLSLCTGESFAVACLKLLDEELHVLALILSRRNKYLWPHLLRGRDTNSAKLVYLWNRKM
jgi:hypothetical protein